MLTLQNLSIFINTRFKCKIRKLQGDNVKTWKEFKGERFFPWRRLLSLEDTCSTCGNKLRGNKI